MKASILINNYNYQEYIEECLTSVINQSYKSVEIILFDDNSKDNSVQIAKKFANNIKIIENTEIKSKYNSHNQFNAIKKAFYQSTGDVIFLLDSDDYFLKNKVEKVMRYYHLNPDAGSIQDSIITLDNNFVFQRQKYLTTNSKFDALDYVLKVNLIFGLGPQTSGLSFRRDYFKELISKYDFNVPLIWPDIQLGRKALFEKKAIIIKEPYTIRRFHNHNDSSKLKERSVMIKFLNQYSKWFNDSFNAEIDLNYKKKNKIYTMIKIIFYVFRNLNFKSIGFFYFTLKK
jgi:glycosyltransferase involved in cell wall biosynthesis